MTKILVIENATATRNLFLKCLQDEGFDTISAENGRIGVQRIQEELPDLILCDIVMPELDGYSVLNTLRQDIATAAIPFIFVTAEQTRADIRKGMELGADDYLTKPCTIKELLTAITTRLEKQIALKQWYATESQQVLAPLPVADAKLGASHSIFPSCPQLRKVFHFIETNYNQPITLKDVAQAVGYSPAYLTNLVRQQTGQTVHRWIIKRRILEARFLLLETDLIVEQIAAKVGYNQVVSFFRHFRQIHGQLPKLGEMRNAPSSARARTKKYLF